jgi:hypothetical protein
MANRANMAGRGGRHGNGNAVNNGGTAETFFFFLLLLNLRTPRYDPLSLRCCSAMQVEGVEAEVDGEAVENIRQGRF